MRIKPSSIMAFRLLLYLHEGTWAKRSSCAGPDSSCANGASLMGNRCI